MTKQIRPASAWLGCLALALLCLGNAWAAEQRPSRGGGDGPAGPADPPREYKNPAPTIDGPSIAEGQPAGIEAGQYAPDFDLQPIEPYPIFQKWLGKGAPKTIDQKIKLSQFVGKAPVLLLYGSYT